MRLVTGKRLLFIVYLFAYSFLAWILWTFLYQYIAALSHFHEVSQALVSERILAAFWLSVSSSIVTVIVSVLFGIPVAYLFATKKFRGRTALETFAIDLPQTFPPAAEGILYLVMLGPNSPFGINIAYSFAALVIAKVFISAPFVISFTMRRFREIQETELDIIALTLGAHPGQVLWTVYLPLASRDIVASVALCWSRAMGELGGSLIFAGAIPFKTETIPTFIELNPTLVGPALAAAILVTTASAFGLIIFKSITHGNALWKALVSKI